MHGQGIGIEHCEHAAGEEPDERDLTGQAVEAALMALLLSDCHEGPWTRAEIELEMSSSPLYVHDAIAGLQGAGLLHAHGELVFASRAARRMDELEL